MCIVKEDSDLFYSIIRKKTNWTVIMNFSETDRNHRISTDEFSIAIIPFMFLVYYENLFGIEIKSTFPARFNMRENKRRNKPNKNRKRIIFVQSEYKKNTEFKLHVRRKK